MVAVRRALAGALVVLSLGACRAIADLRDLSYVPGSDVCSALTLPTAGDARVRLVNAGTSGRSDFCVRPSAAASWGSPVLHQADASCPSGLDYAQATVPFAVAVGSIDVEAIPAGSTCDATPTSQLLGVPVADASDSEGGASGSVVALVRFGRASAEGIVALPEEPAPLSEDFAEHLRVVNALSSGEAINFGLTSAPTQPFTVASPILPAGLPPGAVPAAVASLPPLGSIDAYGYLSTEPFQVPIGVVLEGRNDALFTVTTPLHNGDTQSLFVLGDSSDAAHPLGGLFCEDAPPGAAAGGDGGADEGGAATDGGAAPSPILAACRVPNLPAIAVDTFNVSLYGEAAPYESDRRPKIIAAIAARTTDLMCILDANRDVDKDAIAAAAKTQFPFAFYAKTDLTTPVDQPAAADGGIPPAPAGPPCGGGLASQADTGYACAEQSCASPADATGILVAPACLTASCASSLGPLRYGTDAQKACLDCILLNGVSQLPLGQGEQTCTTSNVAPFAFSGMTPQLILSRYPLSNQRAYILPATGFRRAVLYAQVQLEDQSVDFYCAELSSPFIDQELPYEGSYGVDGTKLTLPDGGTSSGNGWEDEQNVQVEQVASFVQQNSGKRPAILAGDWHASTAASISIDGGMMQVVADTSPEVLRVLDTAFVGGAFMRAEPPGHQPFCTYCPAPQNPYNSGVTPVDISPTFLSGFQDGSVTDDSLWPTDNGAVTLTATPYQPGGTGPIAEFYPRTVRVLRPTH